MMRDLLVSVGVPSATAKRIKTANDKDKFDSLLLIIQRSDPADLVQIEFIDVA
jgi:hypothetical protein